ncbi:hypothetical protein CK936_04250, partial [Streptomyces albireticuli]
MGFGSVLPADGGAFELVEQGEGLFHGVAEFAQALDVRGAFAGDDRQDLPPCAARAGLGWSRSPCHPGVSRGGGGGGWAVR